jgi:hypothetical protein
MAEKIVKTMSSPNGKRRAFIVHRSDNLFGFREEEQVSDYHNNPCWTPTRASPSGLFDTEQLAEQAARAELEWLKSSDG